LIHGSLIHLVLRNLVLPPAAPLLLSAAGLLLVRDRPVAGRTIAWCGVALLWLLSISAVAGGLLRIAQKYPALDLARPTGAAAIVILGAGAFEQEPEYAADAPDGDTLARIAYGAYVAQSTGLPVLVSGASTDSSTSVASVMERFLQRDFHCPVRWVEERSFDTHENALFSAAILRPAGVQRVILVTSATHMARSVQEFEAAGLQVVPAPTAFMAHGRLGVLSFVPNIQALHHSRDALYELFGRAVLWLKSIQSQTHARAALSSRPMRSTASISIGRSVA
jgi:uncharacterized SAM-binding protein YcdF (DUF218 family)